MDTEDLEIYELNAPEIYKCYIEFKSHWRASRLAAQMIHAEMSILVDPLPNDMYRIYFKKDMTDIVEKILKGNY